MLYAEIAQSVLTVIMKLVVQWSDQNHSDCVEYIKLKLQYFGHLMRRVDSLEKTLMLGGSGGRIQKQVAGHF